MLFCAAVPGAPPRKVEADVLNSTALRVTWKSPLSVKQHGQIRGYQLVYSRLENGEPHGQPVIMDVSIPEAQVLSYSYKTESNDTLSRLFLFICAGAMAGLLNHWEISLYLILLD